jgi:thioredoxin-disulfide reductase
MLDFQIQKRVVPTIFDDIKLWDILIIGGGPAGMNAALYAQRKGFKVAILSKEIGGQLHNTSTVDNYLGISMTEGKDLSATFLKHIETLQVPLYLEVSVDTIKKIDSHFHLYLDNGVSLVTKTVLLATGGQPKQLGIPGEKEFANKGVSYCTTCDAPFFKDKHVIVAGGGNSAAEAVIDLSSWAKKITVIHRSQWRADKIILEQLNKLKQVTVHLETQLLRAEGDQFLKRVVVLDKKSNKESTIEADGLFIQIGLIANSSLVQDLVSLTAQGEVVVNQDFMSSMPGLFAAGDVTHHPFKQIVIAVGDGAKAALAIQQYLLHHS